MASSTLSQPYTARRAPGDGSPLKYFCNAAPNVQQLYLTSNCTSAIVIVEHSIRLTMNVAPHIKKADGKLTEILLNSSNTELTPSTTGPASTQFFATLASRRKNGDFFTEGRH